MVNIKLFNTSSASNWLGYMKRGMSFAKLNKCAVLPSFSLAKIIIVSPGFSFSRTIFGIVL